MTTPPKAPMPDTLGDALPKEQERCRELLIEYRSIGPSGIFGARVIECALRDADKAVMSGDAVEMLRTYQALKEIQ